jgi:hypothetical protein
LFQSGERGSYRRASGSKRLRKIHLDQSLVGEQFFPHDSFPQSNITFLVSKRHNV